MFSLVKIDSSICTPRHTHSMTTWKDYVVISGGLGEDENVIDDILLLNTQTYEIKKLQLSSESFLKR